MVVVLVALTFTICIAVDRFLMRSLESESIPVGQSTEGARPQLSEPKFVGGFKVHEELSFHPGHAWAAPERMGLVRVGLDDFARRLIGSVDWVELPQVGDHVVQGREGWVVHSGKRAAPMLAPVTGQVVLVNAKAKESPELMEEDMYGEGWLFLVRTGDLRTNLNNLLSGGMVHHWMEEVCARLRSSFNGGLSVSFADGGTAVDDLSSLVDKSEWEKLAKEFLLTAP